MRRVKPIAAAEMVAMARLPRPGTRVLGAVTIRGVSPQVFALTPGDEARRGAHAGRAGCNELLAGRAAQARFGTFGVGQRVKLGNAEWKIVGAFTSGDGNAHDAELFADAETMLSAYQRTTFNSVTVEDGGTRGVPDAARRADERLRRCL